MVEPTSQVANNLFLWSEIARNFGIVLAGMIGLGIAWWRSRAANIQAQAALEQSELARRDHITELFNRAVGQLGDEKLEVRLGAIYTLQAICQDQNYGQYTRPVIETLTAFVRESDTSGDGDIPVDIHAIAEVLVDATRKRKG